MTVAKFMLRIKLLAAIQNRQVNAKLRHQMRDGDEACDTHSAVRAVGLVFNDEEAAFMLDIVRNSHPEAGGAVLTGVDADDTGMDAGPDAPDGRQQHPTAPAVAVHAAVPAVVSADATQDRDVRASKRARRPPQRFREPQPESTRPRPSRRLRVSAATAPRVVPARTARTSYLTPVQTTPLTGVLQDGTLCAVTVGGERLTFEVRVSGVMGKGLLRCLAWAVNMNALAPLSPEKTPQLESRLMAAVQRAALTYLMLHSTGTDDAALTRDVKRIKAGNVQAADLKLLAGAVMVRAVWG